MKDTRGEQRRRRKGMRRRRGEEKRTELDSPPVEGEANRVRNTSVCVCVCGEIVVQNFIYFAKDNSSHGLIRRPVLSGCDDTLETLTLLFSLSAPTTVNSNSYKCLGTHSFFSGRNLGWHFNAF